MTPEQIVIAIVFGAIGGFVGFYVNTALIERFYTWKKNRDKERRRKRG